VGKGWWEKTSSINVIMRKTYSPLPPPPRPHMSTETAPRSAYPLRSLLVSCDSKQGDGRRHPSGFPSQSMGLPVCRVHPVLSQTNARDGDLAGVGKSPASGISPCCRGLSARGLVSAGGPGQCRGRRHDSHGSVRPVLRPAQTCAVIATTVGVSLGRLCGKMPATGCL